MGKAKAEASTILLAPEAVLGTAPATGWLQTQVNPAGIQGWAPAFVTVERDPLSKYASREKGDNVGLNAEPKLVHDLNKDWMDIHAPLIFRSVAKHAGNKGQSLYRPTAVTATGYTVPANGDLTAGLLVHAKGFSTAANNGLKAVAAASAALEVKAAGLVAEAAPPTNVTLEVAGVQGAVADIVMTAAGHLTATVLNFTTLGLNVGQWIKIGGTAANTFFATATLNGRARIKTIAAGQLTLERWSFTPAADAGAGKTIQLFFSRWYRNTSIDHVDYLEQSLHGELEEIGPGTGNTATYSYAKGMNLKTFELDAPLESKIVTTASYVGMDIADPVLVASRAAGASTALAPLASALIDTATDLKKVRLTDTAGELIAEINSWKLTYESNVKPQKVQGVLGANGMIYGKFTPTVSMEAYYTTSSVPAALRDNRDLQWDAYVQNHQVAFLFDLPNVALRGGARAYAANESVMVSAEVPAFRDQTTNIVSSLSVFAHIPE